MFGAIAQTWYETKCINELEAFAGITRKAATNYVLSYQTLTRDHRAQRFSHLSSLMLIAFWVLESRDKIARTGDNFDGVGHISIAITFALAYIQRFPSHPDSKDFLTLIMQMKEEANSDPLVRSMG